MALDSAAAYEEALASWPMPRVLAHFGMSQFMPPAYKKEPCPFCGRKGKFSAFTKKGDGKWLVKCQIDRPTPCEANKAMDEIGLIQRKEGLPDRKAAYMRFLELAGVVIENAPVAQPAPQAAPESAPVVQPAPQPPLETLFQPQPEAQPEPANVVPFLQGSNTTGAKPKPPPPPPSGPNTDNIWATLHPLLLLTNADRERLKSKRGFSDSTIDALGFKSSNPTNIEIINSLRDKFPPHQLLDSGLFVKTPAGGMAPYNQFTGWGITGKKDAKGNMEWGATNPILIPYRDANGKVTSIRPHKGGIPRRDKDDDEHCGGEIYCPLLIETRLENFDNGSPLFNTVVLTESEFKAAAIWQAGFAAIGIPGTSFVRNPIFRAKLVAILERFGIQRVIIVFDNEVKDKPGLPSYKADPFDRYWQVIWARYIAWDLIKRSPRPAMLDEVQIGNLRDEWRLDDSGVDTGKVDWDTALAMFVRKEGVIHGTARASQEFEKVLLEAQPPNDFLDLFPDIAQTIIGTRLENLWHTPLLKSGGDDQEKLARRLDRISSKLSTVSMAIMAQKMTAALRSVIGCYYVLKVTPDKVKASYIKSRAALNTNITAMLDRRGEKTPAGLESIEAMIDRLTLERRLLTELIEEGTPEAISNFTAKCEFCRHTADHKTERLVRIKNTQGEKTKLLSLPAESNGRLAEFRVWCLERTEGVAVWRGGEKDLQNLTEDMKHLSAHRNIFEVPHYGFDLNSKIVFFGDTAWAPDGEMLLPDENNIFWHSGMGYQVDVDASTVGEGFQQGAPKLAIRPGDEGIDLKQLFQNFSDGMLDTVGDYDGLLCVGMSLLFAAAQQVYRDHGGHPGLWLYGKRGGGKTTVARWLMRIWGFNDLQGIRLDKTTTAVGMARNLTQYADIPLWFDEYRRNIPDVELKEAVLRGAYDRSSGSKGRMDSTTKTNSIRALTTPIVSGEMSSPDAATRSRFVHTLIATSRRRRQGEANAALFRTMTANANHLHLIGRYLMDNRKAFNESFTSLLSIWTREQLAITDDRTRFVHGAAWAAFMALAEILNINVNVQAFTSYTVQHSNLAFEDVHDETMANRFWTDVVSAINRGNIDRRLFDEKTITLNPKGAYDPALVELSGAPRVKAVFLAPNEVFDMYALDLRRRGDTAPLSKNDIQREISKEDYWIEPAGTQRIHRATLNGHRYNGVWVINLETFPFAEQLKDALEIDGSTAGI